MTTIKTAAPCLINTFDQLRAAGGGVAICVGYGGSRERYVSGWSVQRLVGGKLVPTDKAAAWYHHGQKVFPLQIDHRRSFHERRGAALAAAQAWVKAQGWYEGEWKQNAVGDFVPAEIQRRYPIKRGPRGK